MTLDVNLISLSGHSGHASIDERSFHVNPFTHVESRNINMFQACDTGDVTANPVQTHGCSYSNRLEVL